VSSVDISLVTNIHMLRMRCQPSPGLHLCSRCTHIVRRINRLPYQVFVLPLEHHQAHYGVFSFGYVFRFHEFGQDEGVDIPTPSFPRVHAGAHLSLRVLLVLSRVCSAAVIDQAWRSRLDLPLTPPLLVLQPEAAIAADPPRSSISPCLCRLFS